MVHCPSCGEENPAKFRLCGYCGAPLAAAPGRPHEVRKTVTIVFCDLMGSTALGERVDTEALHELKERYFATMSAEIARHGGKVEKFIGDAIMAVFGLPRAHEDDALRAVRAAAGMRRALADLNEDLRARYGVQLAVRTGVNTGEVVANDDPGATQKLATGDAVNTAARLEQAAPENQIYLGDTTFRLVRDAVQVEAVEPLDLKGKAERVAAWRLVAAQGEDGVRRRHDQPLVGRESELAALDAAYRETVDERAVRLVTLIGDAGVGKSRLVHEVIERFAAGARVLSGRCLPYGDGITFWPLRGMVLAAAHLGNDEPPELALRRLHEAIGDAPVADRLAGAVGLSGTAYPLAETYWAARRFFEVQAAAQPLVVFIDDIHWAERAFLDLLDHVLATAGGVPILLLATARHDLVEELPDWGTQAGARRLVLAPLSDAAAGQVVANRLGSAALPAEVVARIVRAAEGNPLYVEQMLSMLVESGALREQDGRWIATERSVEITIPPTIHALLEARLDRLAPAERATVEPASVIGLEFPRPAIESLAPAPLRDGVGERLDALVHKQFIRPTVVAEERAAFFRFHHHLVREAVYGGLLKRARAQLHLDFVRWADGINGERGLEFEEILGYHLEQAHRYLGELGPLDATGRAAGADGARRLSSAGRRAAARGDMHAAENLLRRAVALLPASDPVRLPLLPELAETLRGVGDFAGAKRVLDEALALAETSGNRRVAAGSRVGAVFVSLYDGQHEDWSDEALRVTHAQIPLLEAEQADNELSTAWRIVALVHGNAGRFGPASDAVARSIAHARRAGNERMVARSGLALASLALNGATPVPEAIALCRSLLDEGLADRQVECNVRCLLAQLRAMAGEINQAREMCLDSRAVLRDLGQGVYAASTGIDLARIALHGDDLVFAEAAVRADHDFLASKGETYFLSTMAALLARIVREQGRDAEALALTQTAEAATAADDVESQALWRMVRAPVLARAGDPAAAEALAREAIALLAPTEAPMLKADALAELAAVLAVAGRDGEARTALADAAAIYRAKGNRVMTERCEARAV